MEEKGVGGLLSSLESQIQSECEIRSKGVLLFHEIMVGFLDLPVLGEEKNTLLLWCYFIFSSSAATSLIDPLLHCCSQTAHLCLFLCGLCPSPHLQLHKLADSKTADTDLSWCFPQLCKLCFPGEGHCVNEHSVCACFTSGCVVWEMWKVKVNFIQLNTSREKDKNNSWEPLQYEWKNN